MGKSSRRGDQAWRCRIDRFSAGVGASVAPWWNPDGATPAANVGAWLAKGAASQAASYLNFGLLGNPDIDPVVVGGVAPTWAAGTGWTFDGATTYLMTGIIPTAAVATWSMIIQYANRVAGPTDSLIGSYNAGLGAFVIQLDNATMYCYNGLDFPVGLAANIPSIASGNYGFSAKQPYRNGVAEATVIPAGASTYIELYIGADNGGGGNFFQGDIIAAFVSNVTLTAPQFVARATAMAAL